MRFTRPLVSIVCRFTFVGPTSFNHSHTTSVDDVIHNIPTRWAPTSCKWSSNNPCKQGYNPSYPFIRPFIRVTTPFVTIVEAHLSTRVCQLEPPSSISQKVNQSFPNQVSMFPPKKSSFPTKSANAFPACLFCRDLGFGLWTQQFFSLVRSTAKGGWGMEQRTQNDLITKHNLTASELPLWRDDIIMSYHSRSCFMFFIRIKRFL